MEARVEKKYGGRNACGGFRIEHRYYRNGKTATYVGNCPPSPFDDIEPFIQFTQYYHVGNERSLRISIFCPKHLNKNITGWYAELSKKSMRKLNLDQHKTWFSEFASGKPVLSFRRVPRKWIPEFDKLFELDGK